MWHFVRVMSASTARAASVIIIATLVSRFVAIRMRSRQPWTDLVVPADVCFCPPLLHTQCCAGAYAALTRGAIALRRPKRRRVGIFGLSANPPTFLQGHAGVVAHFAGTLDEARYARGTQEHLSLHLSLQI